MPSILSKNCVLIGDVDSYCLVCCTLLPEDPSILTHIQDAEHQARLETVVYVDKFHNDLIIKVNGVYFCELCNMTFHTTARVSVHVKEDTHLAAKGTQLKRVGTSIVFQNDIVIEENAWNGLVENSCVICGADFEDYLTHKSKPNHALSVIRNKVIVDEENNIYRKVNGGYHCLTCNKVESEKRIINHFNSVEHKNSFLKNDSNENDIKNVGDNQPNMNVEEMKKADDLNVKPVEANDQPFCSDGKTLFTRPVLMKDKAKPSSAKTFNSEVENLAKQYNLSVNKFNNTVHCRDCNLQVPAIQKCVKEHVEGKKHKTMVEKPSSAQKKNDKKIEKIRTDEFITRLVSIKDGFGQEYVVINKKFCLESRSFIGLVKQNNEKLVCQFCQIDLTPGSLKDHLITDSHLKAHQNSSVITSLENEFVRQIKSDLFHCGFCGHLEVDFDDMLDHLESAGHKLIKAEKGKLLQQFNYEIWIHERRQEFHFLQFLNGLSNKQFRI